MMLTDLVFAQAALLAGELDPCQMELLRVLCGSMVTALSVRLRDGFTPEDCKAEFVAAAGLYALAALQEAGDITGPEEFRAGDLTVRKKGTDVSCRCLRKQAALMIQPYLKDAFSFAGV